MERKSWKTKGILAASLLVIAAAVAIAQSGARGRRQAGAGGTPIATPAGKRVVEVVFVLDTTGSMAGLIEGAKAKIWAMASHIAKGQPTPELRVGLIGYRDVGEAYVTRVYGLTGDLDSLYGHLMQFQAEGGGDTPEHVNKALHDAVHGMQWSPGAMKMVFLVGDAPPHMDYGDGYDYRQIVRDAANKQIVVHAIRCGNVADTATVWQEIARAGQGTFATIDQQGGVLAIATPMDAELAALSRRYDGTMLVYGGEEAHRRVAAKGAVAAAAPEAAAADRGGYYAATGAKVDDADVLGDIATGRVAVGSLAPEKLPAEARGLGVEERQAWADKKVKERDEVQRQIKDLSAKRDAYLKAELGKRAHADGFDEVVNKAIEAQAKDFGIKYAE